MNENLKLYDKIGYSMRNKIEIVCGESFCRVMKDSSLNKNNIIKFDTIFSIANLDEIDKFKLHYPNELFGVEDSQYDFSEEMKTLKSLIKTNDIRVWCSRLDSNSYILLCFLCNYLKNTDSNVFAVYSDDFDSECPTHAGLSEDHIDLYPSVETKLSKEDVNRLSDIWIYVKDNKCDLRVMRNKEVKLVSYEFLDDVILSTLKEIGTCKVAKLTGVLMGHHDSLIDLIYVLMIKRLIDRNKIKFIKEDKENIFTSLISL